MKIKTEMEVVNSFEGTRTKHICLLSTNQIRQLSPNQVSIRVETVWWCLTTFATGFYTCKLGSLKMLRFDVMLTASLNILLYQ